VRVRRIYIIPFMSQTRVKNESNESKMSQKHKVMTAKSFNESDFPVKEISEEFV